MSATAPVSLDAVAIHRACALRGLTVRPDAVDALALQLSLEGASAGAVLALLLNSIELRLERDAPGTAVSAALVEDVIAAAQRDDDDVKQSALDVVSAFHTPKFTYDTTRRAYDFVGDTFPLHADADAKTRLYTERLALARARVLRNPLFAPPLLGGLSSSHLPLTPVDQLPRAVAAATAAAAGRPPADDGGRRDGDDGGPPPATAPGLTLLGLLTQPEAGLWCLEDERGRAVALDLSQCTNRVPGMYTETAVVLVQGTYDAEAAVADSVTGRAPSASGGAAPDGGGGSGGGGGASFSSLLSDNRVPGALRVTMLGSPPPELRSATLSAMGIVDPLRALSTPADAARARHLMLTSTPDATATMFAVLSDVHLDSPHALARLRAVLEGFEAAGAVPPLFLLLGNFGSTAFGQLGGDRDAWRRRFDALADLLAAHSRVAQRTHFVLVPGPHDPGSGGALPRPPLPASFCGRLLDTRVLPALTLASNPCRIRYFAQEIVVFRSDVTTRLRRRAVLPPLPPPSERSITSHTVRTIIEQAHLLPLPLSAQPVYWALDHALRLAPTPDVVVLAEDQEPYTDEFNGCLVVNPGSFAADGAFAVLRPTGREDGLPSAELSAVGDVAALV